jgi:hypothetical protein
MGQDFATGIVLDSDMFSPAYGFRLEFRDVPLAPTATLLVKVRGLSIVNATLLILCKLE